MGGCYCAESTRGLLQLHDEWDSQINTTEDAKMALRMAREVPNQYQKQNVSHTTTLNRIAK
jgi:hypothetical protein